MRHLILLALLAASAAAQLQPGKFLAITSGDATQKSIRHLDRFAGTDTPLNVTGVDWKKYTPFDLFIEDEKNFLLAVTYSPLTGEDEGHLFRVTWDGQSKSWKATQLNTAPMVPRTVGVIRLKDTIYLSAGTAGNGSAHDATLFQLPAKGGKPGVALALGKNCTPTPGPGNGTGGPIIAMGTTLHWFMWFGKATNGVEHWAVDTTQTPHVAKKVGNLPALAKRCSLPFLPVGICFDQASFLKAGGAMVIGSRTGDALWRDTSGNNLLHSAPPGQSTLPYTDLTESIAVNTDTGAVLMGDWNGTMEELTCGQHGTWKLNVQALNMSSGAWVQALKYIPAGSTYRKNSNGCPHPNQVYPCSYLNSLPVPGNLDFQLTLESPGIFAVVLFGLTSSSKNLGGWGAPGCWLHPSLATGVILPGTGQKGGFALKAPIPATMQRGWFAHVQWLVTDPKANALGLVVSDSRLLTF